jgi:flagellar hook-associated protein FlgK
VASIKDMVAAINAKVHQTGVVASIDEYNDLKLSVTDPKGSLNISVGPGKNKDGSYFPNALGLEPREYGVTERLTKTLAKDPIDPTEVEIRLSFGSYTTGDPPVETFGDPYDMSVLGLRTGAYIEEGSPDDLLLFVTGKGSAKVAVGFEGQPDNPRDNLRSQSLLVKFTAADRYSIIDAKTGTELADRYYDPNVLEPTIEFQGLQLKLSHAASVGDIFKIDGNQDGLGNNVNMLDMFELSKRPVAGGKTIGNTYIDQINTVGNLSQQAIITQEALKVVNAQAIESRDKVAGVNLDDEAAALVRYQQAYQAAAKALQVSGQLFDAIVQIN